MDLSLQLNLNFNYLSVRATCKVLNVSVTAYCKYSYHMYLLSSCIHVYIVCYVSPGIGYIVYWTCCSTYNMISYDMACPFLGGWSVASSPFLLYTSIYTPTKLRVYGLSRRIDYLGLSSVAQDTRDTWTCLSFPTPALQYSESFFFFKASCETQCFPQNSSVQAKLGVIHTINSNCDTSDTSITSATGRRFIYEV